MYHSECIHFYNGLRLEYSLHLHFQCHADRKCNCNNFYFTENKNYYDLNNGSYKITAIVGFVGGNPDDNPEHQGAKLNGRLVLTIQDGKITSKSWTKYQHGSTGSNNIYYAYPEIISLTIETLG